MQKVQKVDYTFVWGNTQGALTLEGDMHAILNHRDNVWNGLHDMISISRNNKISCYISNKDLENNTEAGKRYLDPAYATQFLKEVNEVCSQHWKLFEKFKRSDFSRVSDDELYQLLFEAVDQWARTIGYFRGSQMAGTQHLIDFINENVNPQDASTLLLPSELDPINHEEIRWREIVSKPLDKEKIIMHVEEYPWLVAYHFTPEDVMHTLSERHAEDSRKQEIKDIKEEKLLLKEKQETILKKNPKVKDTVNLLNQIALSRIKLKSCWAGNDFYLIPLFAEIAKRTNESVKDLVRYYLLPDIKNLLSKKEKLSEKEKNNRKECFAFCIHHPDLIVVSGKKAEELEKRELGDLVVIKNIKELKGVSARPGKYTGKVSILGSNDIEKTRFLRSNFAQGDVLVTEMTQPNIMDIARRAGAIVTDEGGMLSHAAIISREFGIPCIVGTRNATKVLKDGDMVEVDADKGMVKKLS